MEVFYAHPISVDDAEVAHSHRGKRLECGTPEAPGADDEHARRPQALVPLFTQDSDLARVTFQPLASRERRQERHFRI
jgi:hypothetical protein